MNFMPSIYKISDPVQRNRGTAIDNEEEFQVFRFHVSSFRLQVTRLRFGYHEIKRGNKRIHHSFQVDFFRNDPVGFSTHFSQEIYV